VAEPRLAIDALKELSGRKRCLSRRLSRRVANAAALPSLWLSQGRCVAAARRDPTRRLWRQLGNSDRNFDIIRSLSTRPLPLPTGVWIRPIPYLLQRPRARKLRRRGADVTCGAETT